MWRHVCLFALLFPVCVNAQDTGLVGLHTDINTLRAELEKVQDLIINEGNGTLTPSMGPALIRLDQIEQDMRRLTGQLETSEQMIRQELRFARARLDALEVRVDALDGRGPVEIPLRTGASASEVAAFEAANALGLTKSGTDALDQFLIDYPNSVFALDAQNRLAAFAAKAGDWDVSAAAYLDIFSSDPRGPVSSEALLGLGQAFSELGKIEEACLMYYELETRAFSPAFVQEAKAGSATLACE